MAEPGTEIVSDTDLLIVGAGAKATAIASKVHFINQLGLGPISITIVEGTEPAASWLGRNGMTSGEEPLAVTPIKDIGFPYRSFKEFGEAGDAIDAAVMTLSWQQHMVSLRRYARWIDAGSPSVRHRDYGEYLTWVLSRATEGVEMVEGRVTGVSLGADRRWQVEVERGGESHRRGAGALVLTGPGIHSAFPHEPGVAARLFHCDSRREEFAQIPEHEPCEIAVVGGGESALSCVMFLRGLRPRCRYTIYTPMLPLSRGESFLENRVFSDPDVVEWERLEQQVRRDFVKHSDRGVFDPPSLAAIAYDDRCTFVCGRVHHVGSVSPTRVRVEYEAPEGEAEREHDYVVNCTGFDLIAQMRSLFPPELRAEIESRVGGLWETPRGVEIPIGRNLELVGMEPRLQIPGLAGLSQGPGFANLGALGLLANRVLQPQLPELNGNAERNLSTANHKSLLFD
ncbi:MAG TPA: SidA/IucD/PvdA family monooxygenase [Solirubrobacterales bacterium]|nr:SidA/IucD/PvdA family monooxygenase [Solirubrobacterales bacterium]